MTLKTKSVPLRQHTERELPEAELGRVPVVAAILGIAEVTIWKWHKEERLPKPIRLGIRRGITRWRLEEIRRWIAADCPSRR